MFRFFVQWALCAFVLALLWIIVGGNPVGSFVFAVPFGFIIAAPWYLYHTRRRAT